MFMIDEIILTHSTRGMHKLFKHYKKPFCKIASKSFYGLKRGCIFIYTGFWANGMGETDGPIGAYFLYKTFKKLGFSPIILTDKYCKNFFLDCKVLYLEKNDCTKENFIDILNLHDPVAHFSIERLGQDRDGFYKNANQDDIGKYTSNLDELFKMANTPTYAIGDGGNEIGMGNFSDFLEKKLNVNPTCIKSDFPIVASVSNWGAYGFIAYLQIYSKLNLLPDFKEVEEFLKHIVKLGANEGFSGKNILSVDGKGYKIDKEILQKLQIATKRAL